jgi:hypothetical protein
VACPFRHHACCDPLEFTHPSARRSNSAKPRELVPSGAASAIVQLNRLFGERPKPRHPWVGRGSLVPSPRLGAPPICTPQKWEAFGSWRWRMLDPSSSPSARNLFNILIFLWNIVLPLLCPRLCPRLHEGNLSSGAPQDGSSAGCQSASKFDPRLECAPDGGQIADLELTGGAFRG